LITPFTSLGDKFIESTAPDTSGFPEANSTPDSSFTEIEFEFPILTNSSANVSEIVEGNASIVEFSAGSELINTVWAEAGSAINEIANNAAAIKTFEIFIFEVYLR
jgi:hypothetical protein